jgi:HK97 family phage prohead protease
MEYKGLPFELKDFDAGSRRIKVYLSAFGNIDAHSDVIVNGAFTKTIKERFARIKFLWQHDTWAPIGKWEELTEDAFGLAGVATLSNATKGQDAFEYYKEGIITEHSIGFDTIKSADGMQDGREVRFLNEIKLWEGSAVTWGANEKTPVIEMAKSLQITPLQYLKDREGKLIKFLRTSGASDDAHELVELELHHITETYRTLIAEAAAIKSTEDPAPEPFSLNLIEIFNNA